MAQDLERLTVRDIEHGERAHAAVRTDTGLRLLAVLREYHNLTGASRDASLFPVRNRKLTEAIEEAAGVLDLPLWPAMARDTRRTDSWRHNLGITTVDIR